VEASAASAGDTVSEGPAQPVARTLPEKLDYLFATVRPPGQYREYTHEEIAERARAAGHSISASYVHALRRKHGKSPQMRALEAIAAAFGVPVAYFFNDRVAAQLEQNLELIAALNRPEVRAVAMAAAELSPESIQTLWALVARVRDLEGLGEWTDDRILDTFWAHGS
jgi:transcriptional regulator with XRE-family HTH domain